MMDAGFDLINAAIYAVFVWHAMIYQIFTAVACAVIVWRAEGALNNMTPDTRMSVRLAFFHLMVSAGAGLLAILMGYVPGWREVVMSGGVAALMLCERRIRLLSNPADRRIACD